MSTHDLFEKRLEAAYQAWISFPHQRGVNNAVDAIRAALEAADTVVAEEEPTEWITIVLGRENPTDESSNWEVTAWKPEEIDYARACFPGAEYTLAEMKLRGGAK